eukprot:3544923-Pyramimonas_sp.AAC.1
MIAYTIFRYAASEMIGGLFPKISLHRGLKFLKEIFRNIDGCTTCQIALFEIPTARVVQNRPGVRCSRVPARVQQVGDDGSLGPRIFRQRCVVGMAASS